MSLRSSLDTCRNEEGKLRMNVFSLKFLSSSLSAAAMRGAATEGLQCVTS